MDADLRPARAETSLSDLVGEATQHTSTLIRDEVALARVELKEDIRQAVAGISLITAAGLSTLLAVLMLSAAAGFGIGRLLGDGMQWAGFATVGVVYLLAAGIAALLGKRAVEEIPPPLQQSTKQLKDDVEAVKGIRA